VEACWQQGEQFLCGRNGILKLARRADPRARSYVKACCALVPDAETLCDDGRDGDGDCLVDLEDPDCAE
jgi:hypothetical protein